ncbi:hypothetical protein OH77DRAFT_1498132 [Trametes cingulata]|nr:hypothetical protein OH77DRAFT_1498132 [Trametes cingulata]
MSAAALVLWQIYYQPPGSSFNVHKSSTDVIDGTVRSRFIGREEHLLALETPFYHLGNRAVMKALRNCKERIMQFVKSHHIDVELVVVINTHADPRGGGLLYAPGAVTTLDSIIQHIFGEFGFLSFRQSVLFLLCCGGLIKQAASEVRRASEKFQTVFAFGARMLDPIATSCHFIATVLDFYVIGRDTLLYSLQRAAKPEVLVHTSVYVCLSGAKILRMRWACLRRCPNGYEIRCCEQEPKYMQALRNRIKYRCTESVHQGPRTITVYLLPAVEGKRWILGTAGRDRYIVDEL